MYNKVCEFRNSKLFVYFYFLTLLVNFLFKILFTERTWLSMDIGGKIKELREDLNRRFDQLVEMIRKGVPPATNEGDSSKEEEDVHQGRRRGNLGARPPQQHIQHASRRPIYVEAFERVYGKEKF